MSMAVKQSNQMKRLVAILCLIMVTMSSALAQQAKDVTNNTSNMNDSIKREQSDVCIDSAERENLRTKFKSFKSTTWLLPQPVLIIGTYDKGGRIK